MTHEDLSERVLPDDFPVYGNYLYVCDGKVIRCDLIQGTVLQLKHDLRDFYKIEANEIKNCDIVGRRKILEQAANEVA